MRQLRYLRRLRGREAQLVQPVHGRQVLRQGLPAEALEGGRAQKGMLRRAALSLENSVCEFGGTKKVSALASIAIAKPTLVSAFASATLHQKFPEKASAARAPLHCRPALELRVRVGVGRVN